MSYKKEIIIMKMKCPKCGNGLKIVENRGIEVDYCEECKGVWFDFTEIDELSDTIKEFNIVNPRIENLKLAEVNEEIRNCPRCGSEMDKVTMSGKPPVFDFCPFNHGYWFDAKELEEYTRNNMTAVQRPSAEMLSEIMNNK